MEYYIMQNKHFSDVNPIETGQEYCKPGKSFGPYIRDFYLLHFVVSGKGTLYCDKNTHEITPGQIFIIRPGENAMYTADAQNPWHYIWIGFKSGIMEKYDFIKDRVINYSGSVFGEFLNVKNYETHREEYLISKLFQLFAELPSSKNAVRDYAKIAKRHILTSYMNDITLSSIAHHIGIDRSYLSKLFTASVGTSFQQFLIETRLKKGDEFLKMGYNVSEASTLCGYKDSSTFSRAYKKHFNMPPKKAKLPANTGE